MKKITFLLVFATFAFLLKSQQLDVAHISGDLNSTVAGVYGTMGVNYNTHPASLANACMWSSNGAIYLFGGEEYGSFASNVKSISGSFFKWTATGGWESLHANNNALEDNSNWIYSNPIYGTLGVSDALNYPGARVGAAYATGGNGNLYMYGGFGVASDGVGALSDLWQYNPTTEEWTWIAGSNLKDQSATYNSINSTSGNNPGSRIEANMWVDNNGDIWIFGGGTGGYDQLHDNYNSLMKFDGTDWTWVAGSNTLNNPGSNSEPSARRAAAGVYASDGKFYLFGGSDNEPVTNNYNRRSDVWSFDGSSWALEAGTANADNESRNDVVPLADAQLFELYGQIYLQGGYNGYYGTTGIKREFLYRWNGSDFELVSLSGDLSGNVGVYEGSIYPQYSGYSINSGAMVAVLEGEAYLFGGREYYNSSASNDLFVKFNGQSFAYLSGGYGVANERLGPQARPGSRYAAGYTFDENDQTLYVFGGNVYTGSTVASYNDLWCYKNGEWVWLSGSSSSGQSPVYTGASVYPGAREWATLWTDANGDLWLFGGNGPDEAGDIGRLNDLWKYDVDQNSWTWVRGSKTRNASGVSNDPSPSSNTPGARIQSVVWQNSANEVFIFGGLGITSTGTNGRTNDFWKWDGSNWTLVAGTDVVNDLGTPGTKGQASASNYPAARSSACFWGDDDGFYMYGGQGITSGGFGYLDQLWHYDASSGHWTWLAGSTTSKDQLAVYGSATDNDASVNPGNLRGAAMWSDGNDIYVFGGVRWDGSAYTRDNNLWHWDGNNWAWLKGGQNSNYSTKSETSSGQQNFAFENLPSAKESPVYWSNNGAFYLFGGLGLANGATRRMSDLWVLEEANSWDGNWSKTSPISSQANALILSNTAINIDSLQMNTVMVDADFTFDLDEKPLSIAGDIYNYGDWSNIGAIYLNGGQTQNLVGSEWSMDGLLIVESGTTFETGDSLLVKANSASDYGQVYSEGTVNGELEFEYYLDLSPGTNNGRYFHLGPVLEGASISDFNNGGILNTGNTNSSVNTVWQWNANSASWSSPTDGQMSISGAAYAIYAGNNQYGDFILADGTSAGVTSIRGSYPNYLGINNSIYYNDGQSSGIGFAGGASVAATEGWNLLYNPWPFNINFSLNYSSTLNYINNAVYQWDGEQYASVVGGVSTNGGSLTLAPGQAYYVQNTDGGTILHFSFRNSVADIRTSTRRFKNTSNDHLTLTCRDGLGQSDQVVVRFHEFASSQYDGALDAWNMSNASDPEFLDLSVHGLEGNLSIATFHPDTTNAIYLETIKDNAHGDTLELEVDLSYFESFNQVYLEDLALDILLDLKASNNYQFVHDTTFDAKRFQLHFGHSSGLGQKLRENNSAFYFFQTGEDVYLKWQKGEEQNAELSIFNASGALVSRQNWTSKQALLILENEPKGMYTAQLISEDGKTTHSIKILKRS